MTDVHMEIETTLGWKWKDGMKLEANLRRKDTTRNCGVLENSNWEI
jgi:hypothetical protein